MTASTTRKGIKYTATILGAFAVLAVAPATAFATDNEPGGGGGGGCTYTDADGYSIPIDNGQGVFVDGKIVSCKDGKITETTQPLRGGGVLQPTVPKTGGVFQPTEPESGSVFRPPVINRAPVLAKP
ncbi:hypothetical protein [Mycolicibacterium psychrotolerans]|uniref:Uncharacterized protein n=1 Tax=Mycolicibacterium psychrotolerans TaxID=216929 RepID=A0A7I7M306_9MYCO|nr:hypothetical protein [Mycolicibacterium psychrotolerans]BBX66601.1 hypothetical protein MPSYJ_00620 [Mycolicibacterium psychrotolerans]